MSSETAIETTNSPTVDVTRGDQARSGWTYRPHVDIFDTPDELLLVADVPGAAADGIDVSIESGVLTVQAEIAARGLEGAEPTLREYGVGCFHRRFEVDASIDAASVHADYRNGVLTVHLPKSPQDRRRQIPVKS